MISFPVGPLRPVAGVCLSVVLSVMLVGCGGSSSNGNGDPEVTLPPGVQSLGDGAGYDGLRFFLQKEDATTKPGLVAVHPDNPDDLISIDEDAVPHAGAFAVFDGDYDPSGPSLDDLQPHGVFYFVDDGIRYVEADHAYEDTGSIEPRTVSSEGNGADVCVEFVVFDYEDAANARLVYHHGFDEDDGCPGIGEGANEDWKQVSVGMEEGDSPHAFHDSLFPVMVVGDIADGSSVDYLVIDLDQNRGVYKVPADEVGNAPGDDALAEFNIPGGADGDLEGVGHIQHVADLTNGNLVVAIRSTTSGDYGLSYYEPEENRFTLLEDAFDGMPVSGQHAASGNTAYVVMGDELIRVRDKETTEVASGSSGPGEVFVVAYGDHVVWSNGGTVYHYNDATENNSTVESGIASRTEIEGHADGWVFYDAASDIFEGDWRAVAYNMNSGTRVDIASGEWVGASLVSSIDDLAGDLGEGGLSEVFVRYDGNRIGAVNASAPNDGMLSLGSLPSGYESVMGGVGFGPQRLMQVTEEFDMGGFDPEDPSTWPDFSDNGVATQIIYLDTSTNENNRIVSDNPGDPVMVVPYF